MGDDIPLDYTSIGVDTCTGDRVVELMKEVMPHTHDASIPSATDGFVELVDAPTLPEAEHPLLVTSTDGVGTKIAVTQQIDTHDTIGQDLVGVVADGVIIIDMRPVLMTDYITCSHVIPERTAATVTGIAWVCEAAGTPLVGDETTEHPGVMDPGDYDIAGAATDVVDASKLLDPDRVANDDVLIAMASLGLRSDGYSLVRSVVMRTDPPLKTKVEEFDRTLGREFLEPTRLYAKLCLDMMDTLGAGKGASGIHTFSHVTGDGLGTNLLWVLPLNVVADVGRILWIVPPMFDRVRRGGSMTWVGMEDSLNLGAGMVGIVGVQSAEGALHISRAMGVDTWVPGEASFPSELLMDSGAFEGRVVSGTKRVSDGAVRLRDDYQMG